MVCDVMWFLSNSLRVVRGDWMERPFGWEVPCHSRCDTIKIPPCSKTPSIGLNFAALHRQCWCIHISEIFLSGTKNNKQSINRWIPYRLSQALSVDNRRFWLVVGSSHGRDKDKTLMYKYEVVAFRQIVSSVMLRPQNWEIRDDMSM
jgi:hypothetical protein